jgi:hypothetical protein
MGTRGARGHRRRKSGWEGTKGEEKKRTE